MSRARRSLVLFDIDGTLVLTGGAGRASMRAASQELFGCDIFAEVDFAGGVDNGLASRALAAHGILPTPRRLGRLRATYLRRLRRSIVESQRRALPGVHEAVRAVAARGALVGLLTGNWRPGAAIKLGSVDLWEPFAAAPGAFGDDAFERDALLPVAVRRARRRADFDRIVIIGDTPADVQCCRAPLALDCERVAVAVQTGWCSAADLAACRPDLQLVDLDVGLDRLLAVL